MRITGRSEGTFSSSYAEKNINIGDNISQCNVEMKHQEKFYDVSRCENRKFLIFLFNIFLYIASEQIQPATD